MRRQSRGAAHYGEVLDPRQRRKTLLYRAALAIGVMVLLVIGLSLYDNDGSESLRSQGSVVHEGVSPPPVPDETLVEAEPATIPRIDDSVSQAVAPATEHGVDEAGRDESGRDESGLDEANAASDTTPIAEAPSSDADGGSAELREPVAETRQPAAAAPVASKPAETAAAGRDTSPAPRAVASGFQVLASGYVDPASADSLLKGLSDEGYQAVTQSRVTVGRFARRADAERVMTRLRSEHALRGIIVNAPSGAGFAVQLGVFAEAPNAVDLVRRLEASGHSAALHRRVLLGPYPDRQVAEAIVTELKASRALETQIVALPER